MRSAKFAISVPAETMSQVDRAAKRLGSTVVYGGPLYGTDVIADGAGR
jgi:hypothetical protein